MKLLIVDDEKHVRDAIKLLIDRDRVGAAVILEAVDGQAAIEIVQREKPELILTDMMMPVTSGTQLLEWLHAHAPECKTVVVSGHDDFALVRHTVQYGGTDYILKPIDPDQLNAAIGKAAAAWRREEEERARSLQRSIEMNEIKPVYLDKQLSALLEDGASWGQARTRLEREFALHPGAEACRIVSIRMDTMEKGLKDKFGDSQDLLVFSLVNICNEYLQRGRVGVAFRYWGGAEVVLLLWKELNGTRELLEQINDGMARTLRSRLHFGVGGVHPLPEGLAASYREAHEALRRRNLLQRDVWIHLPPAPDAPRTSPLSFADYEQSVRIAVKSGSPEQIQAALQNWFDAVRRLDRITLEQIDYWWNEYLVVKNRWLLELFPNEADAPPELRRHSDPQQHIVALDDRGQFSVSRWQHEFTESLVQLSGLLLRYQQKERSGSIGEIAKYLELHYQDDLSLQDIATRFFLSREYISRKFKQEFGVNLSDYVTGIRMEKAKLLLLNPHLRIADVAASVGFQDEKYFSKVFKKTTGCSPAEYRKQ